MGKKEVDYRDWPCAKGPENCNMPTDCYWQSAKNLKFKLSKYCFKQYCRMANCQKFDNLLATRGSVINHDG